MIYCDTSVMVAALTTEANSAAVRNWLDDRSDRIAISGWVITEFSGALAMKRRMGVLSDNSWQEVMTAWRRLCVDDVEIVNVSETDFLSAAALLNRADLALRSGDALHLSAAIVHGFSLATLDRKFAAAAQTTGVRVEAMGAINIRQVDT